VGDTSGTTTVRETERKCESDGPVDAGLVAELGAAAAGAPDRDAPTPREPTEFALSATAVYGSSPLSNLPPSAGSGR